MHLNFDGGRPGNGNRLDQVTGIGSRSTFWRPIGGRRAELFALGFVRDLGSSPVAASIKKPRMRSYQTACSVLLRKREKNHVWRKVKDLTELRGLRSEVNRFEKRSELGAEDERSTARTRRALKEWRRLLMSTASHGMPRGPRQVSLRWYPEAKTLFRL